MKDQLEAIKGALDKLDVDLNNAYTEARSTGKELKATQLSETIDYIFEAKEAVKDGLWQLNQIK